MMTEDFLHYVWRNRMYDNARLATTDGLGVEVLFPGYHNYDAGADFRQAIIRLGSMLWAGDIEIHLKSSDWYHHKHHFDRKYDSVVLHVVYEHDRAVRRTTEEEIPTVELRRWMPADAFEQYERLVQSEQPLGCVEQLVDINPLHLQGMLSTMLMERLLRKQRAVLELVEQSQHDWGEGLYRQLAIGFGLKANAHIFELLVRTLPYKIVSKHSDSLLQVNALLFGQAGLLEEAFPSDDYHCALRYEYEYLRYKYQLTPLAAHQWNRLRMRPTNFPCVRIAQFAALLHRVPSLLDTVLSATDAVCLRRHLAVAADEYWQWHYQFGRKTLLRHPVALGEMAQSAILINAVVPFLFAHHTFSGNNDALEGVVGMLEQLPYENNKVTRIFRGTPFPRGSAYDSQAEIELFTKYCQERRCLECALCEKIIRQPL